MMRRQLVVSALGLALLLAGSRPARGQTATSFEQLLVLVKPGDVVSVTSAAGETVKGPIVKLSSTALGVRVRESEREFAQADVVEITQRRRDSLGNGALIGLGSGAGFALVGVISSCGGNDFIDFCSGGFALAMVGIYGGLGAAIGVGVDALIVHSQPIFRGASRASARISVVPLLSSGNHGVLVSLSR